MANYTTRAASFWAAQVPRGTDFFDQKAELFLGHHKNVNELEWGMGSLLYMILQGRTRMDIYSSL